METGAFPEDSREFAAAGFSNVKMLRRGASGIAYRAIDDKASGQVVLLKVGTGTTDSNLSLRNELDVVEGLVPNTRGLNEVASYQDHPRKDAVFEPTMRGLANKRNSFFRPIGRRGALVLEWIEEEKDIQRPGYHNLQNLIPEKYQTWSDLQILEIAAPFAYLLAQAHKQGIIYNDIGADKADHLYWDGFRQQLKVIDWANAINMKDAGYVGQRRPLHDVRGLAKLLYHMRTNHPNPSELERSANAEALRDQLQAAGHPELATLIYRCLHDIPSLAKGATFESIPESERPIRDGTQLYSAIAKIMGGLRIVEKQKTEKRGDEARKMYVRAQGILETHGVSDTKAVSDMYQHLKQGMPPEKALEVILSKYKK